MTIFIYEFADGTVLKLIDYGFTAAEVFALEDIHGKCAGVKTQGK